MKILANPIGKILVGLLLLMVPAYLFWPNSNHLPYAKLDPFPEPKPPITAKIEANMKKAAEKGDVKAAGTLGLFYALNNNWKNAYPLLRRAGEYNDKTAAAVLANMYANGHGVSVNYRETARWYKIAAMAGNAIASYNLGIMYANGEGVPRDSVSSQFWFSKAVGLIQEKTDGEDISGTSKTIMGRLYANGIGVKQDSVKSYMWYTLALQAANDDATANERAALAKTMSSKKIAEADKLAKAWKPGTKSPSAKP